jgi:hypothetical protein
VEEDLGRELGLGEVDARDAVTEPRPDPVASFA